MSNDHLRKNHEDGCNVIAIKGHLYFQPQNMSSSTIIQTLFDQAGRTDYMRIGLRKDQVSEALSGVPIAYNPLLSGSLPDDEGDFTEGRWLWLKEHVWQPIIETSGTTGGTLKEWVPEFKICNTDTRACVKPEQITDGSGYTWSVNSLESAYMGLGGDWVCPPQCNDAEAVAITAKAAGLQPWRLSVNIRRRIQLRENDSLNLWFGWENLKACGGDARAPQTAMQMWGGIRLLIEK